MSDVEVKVAFDAAIFQIQMATSPIMVQKTALTLATKKAVIAPVARFVAGQNRKEIRNAVQQLIVIVPLSAPSSPDGSSLSDNDWKERNQKTIWGENLRWSHHPHFQKKEETGREGDQSKANMNRQAQMKRIIYQPQN